MQQVFRDVWFALTTTSHKRTFTDHLLFHSICKFNLIYCQFVVFLERNLRDLPIFLLVGNLCSIQESPFPTGAPTEKNGRLPQGWMQYNLLCSVFQKLINQYQANPNVDQSHPWIAANSVPNLHQSCMGVGGGRGISTAIYELYRYVPLGRVCRFQAVYSSIEYINQSVWVQNRVSFFTTLTS